MKKEYHLNGNLFIRSIHPFWLKMIVNWQTCQTTQGVNDAKTLQLQPFVLTQSINDLLTLNDSFATEE